MKNQRFAATVAGLCSLSLLTGLGVTALVESTAGAYGYGYTTKYTTMLTGAKEAPGPGDPDGTGTVAVKIKQNTATVCVVIKMVKNLALPATAAHIHQAAAGVAGPIVLILAPPTSKKPGGTGKSKFCAVVGPTLLQAMLTYPTNFYVNVHTTQFPNGAIRGQLV
jgi:CHRD domain